MSHSGAKIIAFLLFDMLAVCYSFSLNFVFHVFAVLNVTNVFGVFVVVAVVDVAVVFADK